MPSGSPPPNIDLIIPARNEQSNIPALFEQIPTTLFRHIILADNGSSDRTADLARDRGAIIVHESQPGYGAACLAALKWIADQGHASAPAAVAFLDADLSDDPSQLPKLCEPILENRADLVIGTRARLADPGALDPHQRFGNWLACKLIALTTRKRYRDLGPMRIINYQSLQQLNMQDRTWGWTVEMQFKAARQNMNVVEIDVRYRKRRSGKSKISGSLIGSAKAGFKIIGTILTLAWVNRNQKCSCLSPSPLGRGPG